MQHSWTQAAGHSVAHTCIPVPSNATTALTREVDTNPTDPVELAMAARVPSAVRARVDTPSTDSSRRGVAAAAPVTSHDAAAPQDPT
jgi:hypothetical protein